MFDDVQLRCYDLSRGMIGPMGKMLSLEVEAIWHTGVLVYGKEVFWAQDIIREPPSVVEAAYMAPKKVLTLGKCKRSEQEVDEFLAQHSHKYNENTYNLLTNNCNHFSEFFVQYLLDSADSIIPNDIINQHEIMRGHPQGSVILKFIESLGDGKVANPFRKADEQDPFRDRAVLAKIGNETVRCKLQEVLKDMKKAKNTLPIIVMICENLTSNVTNPRFRSLKKSSKKLSMVVNDPSSKALFEALGFNEDDDEFVYPKEKLNKDSLLTLVQTSRCIKELLTADEESYTPPPPMMPSSGSQNPASSFSDVLTSLMGTNSGSTPGGIDPMALLDQMGGLNGLNPEALTNMLRGGNSGDGNTNSTAGNLPELINNITQSDFFQSAIRSPEVQRTMSAMLSGAGGAGGAGGGANQVPPNMNQLNQLMGQLNMDPELLSSMMGNMGNMGPDDFARLLSEQRGGGATGPGAGPTTPAIVREEPSQAEMDEALCMFREMGYTDDEKTKKALKKANNDMSIALDYLMDDNVD